MPVLIAFASIEGQTKKMANFIEKIAREYSSSVQLMDTSDPMATVEFDDVDRVILIAPVHERRHPQMFEAFVACENTALDARRTLMISVSLSAAFPKGLEDAQDYLEEMKMRTELDPDTEMLVAGAIRSRNYGYYETQVLKHVVLRGRNFDPAAQEHEFTDWVALGDGVAAFLEGKTP